MNNPSLPSSRTPRSSSLPPSLGTSQVKSSPFEVKSSQVKSRQTTTTKQLHYTQRHTPTHKKQQQETTRISTQQHTTPSFITPAQFQDRDVCLTARPPVRLFDCSFVHRSFRLPPGQSVTSREAAKSSFITNLCFVGDREVACVVLLRFCAKGCLDARCLFLFVFALLCVVLRLLWVVVGCLVLLFSSRCPLCRALASKLLLSCVVHRRALVACTTERNCQTSAVSCVLFCPSGFASLNRAAPRARHEPKLCRDLPLT